VNGTATIRFTEDKRLAANSLRSEVVSQEELFLTAVAKDEALADADAGRFRVAAQKLASQASALDLQCQNAPAPMQSQLRQEATNLRSRATQLEQNQYDAATRKSIQNKSWTVRNSK
jgi:hypothetical protein